MKAKSKFGLRDASWVEACLGLDISMPEFHDNYRWWVKPDGAAGTALLIGILVGGLM